MVLFLAINTSSVTLLPVGVIALRAAAGSTDPAGILPTTLFATICSTTVAIIMAKLCQRYWPAGAGQAGSQAVPGMSDHADTDATIADGDLVSTFQGSTETTLYVLAVYFGAIGIRRIRHTLVAALSADIVGIGAPVFIVSWLYGG